MSYDLDVCSDAQYSKALPVAEMASIVGALPGVTRLAPTQFVLDRRAAGIHVNIDLVHETGSQESTGGGADRVNSVALTVPYPLLEKSGAAALEVAFQIAERCGWQVYDPQGDSVLTRESSGKALELQQASGAAARTVMDRAANAKPSFGDLFGQEQWNHSLVAVVLSFAGAAAAAIAFMFQAGLPVKGSDRFFAWTLTLGGLACLWLKSAVQTYVRLRRLRRDVGRREDGCRRPSA
jgi:hypothetical protein